MVVFSGLLARLKSWNRARKKNRRKAQIESNYLMWRERNRVAAPRARPNGLAVEVVCVVESLDQLREAEKALLSLRRAPWHSFTTLLIGAASLISHRGGCWSDALEIDSGDVTRIDWLDGRKADWFCLCAAGCVPTANALAWMAEAIRRRPDATMIFGDAELDTDVAPRLFAKSEPALLFQIQTGYVGDVVLVRRADVIRHLSPLQSGLSHFLYALGCELLGDERAQGVIRVPRVLARCASSFRYLQADKAEMGAMYYKRLLGVRASLALDPSKAFFLRRARQAAEDGAYPLVSVIIPTRDRVDLLKVCIESLSLGTDYPALEVLIIDNGSVAEETLSYMRTLVSNGRARVIRDDGVFNYSRLNNLAVGQATGQFVLLLNNDIEVVDPDWLTLMVDVGRWSRAGCVGARLHYPSGELQHAGLVLGCGGGIAHVLRASHMKEGRGDHWASFTHEVSAVTGACLLISRDNYLHLGGLNEQDLGVAFNDVDLCLRAREAGLINIYVGEAHLLHYESISRGSDAHDGNIRRWRSEWMYMNRLWGKRLTRDFYANPNYSKYGDQFELAARISKW